MLDQRLMRAIENLRADWNLGEVVALPRREGGNRPRTGAPTPLTFRQKSHRQIGVAEVIRPDCLAWEDGEFCMVCQEVCPYYAIDADYSEQEIARPVVKTDVCRGCGACQSKCPGRHEGAGKGIIVRGVRRQRQLAEEEDLPPASLPATWPETSPATSPGATSSSPSSAPAFTAPSAPPTSRDVQPPGASPSRTSGPS